VKRNADLRLAAYFGPGDILPHCGELSRDEIVRKLVEDVYRSGSVPPVGIEETVKAVLDREQDGSTVIMDGLALPHARIAGLAEPRIAVATSERGVVWPGEESAVHVVFLLLIPQDKPALYLQILRALTTSLKDDATLRTVAAMTNAGDIHRFFESGKAYLPRYITAADIMARDFLTLKDTDTLQTCVDTFIRHQVSEVAVLDRDGDLKGVVRAGELLRVCLPEYLLWMSDLSPIANFEPFAQVLENERRTWLSEILVSDFPVVSPDTPAVQVAGEMTRYKSSKCYVREGGKLVGIVRLPKFLNKIFRE
jgi:mannitol/fructose-specific phosphotransferase system IIA component (Ntr-type)